MGSFLNLVFLGLEKMLDTKIYHQLEKFQTKHLCFQVLFECFWTSNWFVCFI